MPTQAEIDAGARAMEAAGLDGGAERLARTALEAAEAGGEVRAGVDDKTIIQLDAIASQIRRWLEWHKARRDKENLVTVGDTSIMALPVPMWPSHSQFEAWIATLEEAAERLL